MSVVGCALEWGLTGVERVGGCWRIVPGGKWNDKKNVKNKIHRGLRRPPMN
jgi:hypothetical protein